MLGRGLGLLEDAVADLGAGQALPGETAFKLYDTYGFPLDLTQDALRARYIDVETDGFDAAMARTTGRGAQSLVRIRRGGHRRSLVRRAGRVWGN